MWRRTCSTCRCGRQTCAATCVEQKLRDLGLWTSIERPDFYGPAGLQITDLCHEIVKDIRLSLARTSGVDLASSAQSDALYDLFLAPGRFAGVPP